MSKFFPNLFDKDKDFWNFDNMVNEYDWESRNRKNRNHRAKPVPGVMPPQTMPPQIRPKLNDYDIIRFDLVNLGVDEDNTIQFDMTATNHGNAAVTELYIQEFFYDRSGHELNFSFDVCPMTLLPGESGHYRIFYDRDIYPGDPADCRIEWYDYELAKPDRSGFRRYRIDRQTGELYGSKGAEYGWLPL